MYHHGMTASLTLVQAGLAGAPVSAPSSFAHAMRSTAWLPSSDPMRPLVRPGDVYLQTHELGSVFGDLLPYLSVPGRVPLNVPFGPLVQDLGINSSLDLTIALSALRHIADEVSMGTEL